MGHQHRLWGIAHHSFDPLDPVLSLNSCQHLDFVIEFFPVLHELHYPFAVLALHHVGSAEATAAQIRGGACLRQPRVLLLCPNLHVVQHGGCRQNKEGRRGEQLLDGHRDDALVRHHSALNNLGGAVPAAVLAGWPQLRLPHYTHAGHRPGATDPHDVTSLTQFSPV